jgi:hypothetical protein
LYLLCRDSRCASFSLGYDLAATRNSVNSGLGSIGGILSDCCFFLSRTEKNAIKEIQVKNNKHAFDNKEYPAAPPAYTVQQAARIQSGYIPSYANQGGYQHNKVATQRNKAAISARLSRQRLSIKAMHF